MFALVFILLGAGLALGIGQFRGAGLPITPLFIYAGGFIAISAMLLPGVSGSFLLLMLGLYQSTLAAVTDFDLLYIAIFGGGAASGFVVFSRVIRALLKSYHDQTILFLTGLLIGSLNTTWPWKFMDSSGLPTNVWPSGVTNIGGNAQVGFALLCLVVGFVLVLAVTFAGDQADSNGEDKHDAASV